jgi:multiple sugar transport system permease protein
MNALSTAKKPKPLHAFEQRKELIQEACMLLPAIILLITFIVVPFCMSVPLSLTNQRLIQGPVATKFIWLRNYIQILSDPKFWQAFRNIFYFTILVLPIQCGLSLILAFFLNKQVQLKKFLRAAFFLPYITPMVIVTVIWSTLFQYPSGVINSILMFLTNGGFKPIDWLGNAATAMPAIVFLSAWQAYGFQMVIYLAGLQNIPDEQYEAADVFGANGWQKFRYVTWPYLRNTNILVLTITTIQALKLFTQVNILTNGGPLGATNTLVHYSYEAGFISQKIGYSSASSLIMFILVMGIVFIQRSALKLNKD